MRIIDNFDVDRFGKDEDYYSTYRSIGGSRLNPEEVQNLITACIDYILPRYKNPKYFDCFPQLEEAFRKSNPGLELSAEEMGFISKTFAFHECGHVPESHVECIKQLAKTHRLGVVSNIWAGKGIWIEEFERKGILDLFEVLIFSSDYSSIKPSPLLFNEAINAFKVSRDRFIFIGDSPYYDITGAKAAGLRTVLTTDNSPAPKDLDPEPDFIVPDIPHLLGQM